MSERCTCNQVYSTVLLYYNNEITVWGLFNSGKAVWNHSHVDYNNMHTDTYKLLHSDII